MIRRLTARDASAWHALRLRGLRAHPDAFTSTWAHERKDGPARVRARLCENVVPGAFVGGALAATLAFNRETNPKTRHRAYVWGVYVAPEHRGLGRRRVDEELMVCFLGKRR